MLKNHFNSCFQFIWSFFDNEYVGHSHHALENNDISVSQHENMTDS